ncbi:HNH endonuclease signature motif containing protein [Blastococcus sp. SYSU DS0973]
MARPKDWWQKLSPEERAEVLARSAATRARNTAAQAERERGWSLERQKQQAKLDRARQRRARSSAQAVTRTVPGGGSYVFKPLSDLYAQRRSARFWPYVDRSAGPDACWPWHGNRRFDTDYGNFSWEGRPVPAHRIAWTLHHHLIIPYELVVDHLCGCKWCQNWDHLEPVTRDENVRRIHRRSPEATRTRTSHQAPWGDRWYPFGRRLYDADGVRLAGDGTGP